jgi:hypothetical protein
LAQRAKNWKKYSKCPQNITIGRKIAIKIPNDYKLYQHFSFQSLPKYSQTGIFIANIPSGNPAADNTYFIR